MTRTDLPGIEPEALRSLEELLEQEQEGVELVDEQLIRRYREIEAPDNGEDQ